MAENEIKDTVEQQRQDELTDHNYDGIQEYDNPIPGWWHVIFVGSVVFAIAYVAVVHFSPMVPDRYEKLASAQAKAEAKMFGKLMEIPMGEEKVRRVMGNDAWIASGKAVYAKNCALCHAADGEGLIGPNLTDEFYKNLMDIDGIIDVITNGAANNAMPAQKTTLGSNDIALVAGYVASLRGQDLPGPRGVEGVEIAPFPSAIGDDDEVETEVDG
ncbi:MAG: c-type cytochrome [Phycisphaerales bacterium]|nr:c-type cytochrome [Phycisphaerales bacterium]